MAGLLAGLDGRYIAPGKGNDPLRSPESLPTGRNFHAVDGDILPTRLGYGLADKLAAKAAARDSTGKGSEGIILWASDAVRDEGVMVGFALSMMGAEPVWNARDRHRRAPETGRRAARRAGHDLGPVPRFVPEPDQPDRPRLWWLALAASAAALAEQHPELKEALDAALGPVPTAARGHEALRPTTASRANGCCARRRCRQRACRRPTPGAPPPSASLATRRAPTAPA
ncbi:cobaltochelatase subunit CobN [Massilia sp. H-1]|nr:cobaltochelatase subunit CobN [Massilia sp. H-1]